MKKIFKNIWFNLFLFIVIYFCIRFVLNMFNLTYTHWVNHFVVILISVGILYGYIQGFLKIYKYKRFEKFLSLLCFSPVFFVIIIVNVFYFNYTINCFRFEYYEGEKMLKQTTSFLNANRIEYYDYMNPFIRSKQERIKIQYNDSISEEEYVGIEFYDKNGKKISSFKDT